jgi:hypothetical protein
MLTPDIREHTVKSAVQMFHVRPHETLKGRMPNETAGITVEDEIKLLTLIQ